MIRQLDHLSSRELIEELLSRCEYGAIVVAVPIDHHRLRIIRRWVLGANPQECLGAVDLLCRAVADHVLNGEVAVTDEQA